MATLNQFQKYSQAENTVTNNVLLMLSNLYNINPKYFEDFIKGLTDDAEQYLVIPEFQQQINNKGDGIIDGHVHLPASRIIIETKLHALEWIKKLVKYGKSFQENEYKLLIHLSSNRYPQSEIDNIENELSKLYPSGKINFQSKTYEDIVEQLKGLADAYQYEHYLQRLNEDFEAYCAGMNLLSGSNDLLRAMACGQSYDLNIKHQFYFDIATRGYSDFKYLGIYKEKSVRYIGQLEVTVEADWDLQNGLQLKDPKQVLTQDQEKRLIAAIKDSINEGWNIGKEHTFFLLKEFYPTDFKKTSPGGIFRVRFFNLKNLLNPVPKNTLEIAEMLRTKSWV